MSKRPGRLVPSVRLSYSFLRIMAGSDLSWRRLPVMSASSRNPGPVVWLAACGHGEEVGGIVIVHEVFKRIRRRLLCGALYAFPLMNPLGFETATRGISMTREDLNRSFPGNPNGSLGERIADRIFTRILETSPALVLDFHNDWVKSIPYVLIDRNPGGQHKEAYEKAKQAARQTGLCTILDTDELKRCLSYNLLMRDVPCVSLEMGEPYVVNETNVEYGFRAVWSTLSHLKMVEPSESPFRYPLPPAYGDGRLLTYGDKPYGSKTGIVRFLAKPGDVLKAGQPFARIINAFGKRLETVTTLKDAIVLGHTDSSAVFPGMPIMAFGIAGEEPGPEKDTEPASRSRRASKTDA
jgi:predicted deacylase